MECTTSELQQSSTTENRDFMLNMKENVAYTPSAAVPLQAPLTSTDAYSYITLNKSEKVLDGNCYNDTDDRYESI